MMRGSWIACFGSAGLVRLDATGGLSARNPRICAVSCGRREPQATWIGMSVQSGRLR